MKNTKRLEQIRAATAEAIEKHNAELAVLTNKAGQPVQTGDVFLFPEPTEIDLQWVVVVRHSEKPLLFAVPADGHPLVGLTDVEFGSRVMRCGLGLWIHQDEFRPELRVDVVEERHVRRALEKLAQIGSGNIRGSALQRETEANPDYEDWLLEVDHAVDRLAKALRVREVILSSSDFVRSFELSGLSPAPTDLESQFTMTASSAGALARLYEAFQLQTQGGPLVRQVDFLYPGALYLVLEADGVATVYLPEAKQPPPQLHAIDAIGQDQPATWATTPRGTGARSFFSWTDGKVRLRFGHGEHALEITVEQ